MNDQLETYLARPKRYENIDGTTGWAQLTLFAVTVYGVLFPGGWAGKVIKRRITWPRTGYVAYRRPAKKGLAVFFMALAFAAAASFVLVRLTKGHDLMSLAGPGMLASLVLPYLLFLVLGKEPVWKWLVAFFMGLGVSVIGLLVAGSAAELFRPAAWFAPPTVEVE